MTPEEHRRWTGEWESYTAALENFANLPTEDKEGMVRTLGQIRAADETPPEETEG